MASDSLDKPGQRLRPIEKFKMYHNRALPYLQPLTQTWKPWIFIPAMVVAMLKITWMIIVDTADLIWTHFLPASFKDYLVQRNWAHVGFKVFSGILLAFYASIAISLWYGSPWGPGGQWPKSPATDVPFAKHDIKKYVKNLFSSERSTDPHLQLLQRLRGCYDLQHTTYRPLRASSQDRSRVRILH
jgi:hypothetical protein